MRRRKVGKGGGSDPMFGATGSAKSPGTAGPYFGNGGRGHGSDTRPEHGPQPTTSTSRSRKVGGGNVRHFANGNGATHAVNKSLSGQPGGASHKTTPDFAHPMGSHKRHRKIGGASGQPWGKQHTAYVGPTGDNIS